MDKPLFTLWIWPEDRDFEAEEAIRAALRNHGFEWEERVEYMCDQPAVLDTGFGELDHHNINQTLDRYSISDNGLLLLDGKTLEEIEHLILKHYKLEEDQYPSCYSDGYDWSNSIDAEEFFWGTVKNA